MGSFHQGSTARHVAISAFALYALLLEAFLAASAPAPAFAYQGEISRVTCTLMVLAPEFRAEILSSTMDFAAYWLAAASCAYVGTSSAIAAFLPERVASPIRFVLVQGLPARPPLHYFAARGPLANIRSRPRRWISGLLKTVLVSPLGVTSCLFTGHKPD